MSVFDSKADDAPQKWLDIQLTFISVQPPSTLYYATVNIPQPSDSLQILYYRKRVPYIEGIFTQKTRHPLLSPPCPPPLPSHQPTSDKTKQCLPPYRHQALYHHSPQNHHHHHQQQQPSPSPTTRPKENSPPPSSASNTQTSPTKAPQPSSPTSTATKTSPRKSKTSSTCCTRPPPPKI